MTDIYKRLKSLFSAAGLDVSDGSYAQAEAYALSVGAEQVNGMVKNVTDSVFITDSATPDCLKGYARMLGIDLEKTDRETFENALAARLSQNYGDGVMSDGYSAELSLLGECSISKNGSVFTVESLAAEKLFLLGEYIAGGIPFCSVIRFNSNGLTFSQWDSLENTFAFYGKLRLPFSCLDTMDADIIQVQ